MSSAENPTVYSVTAAATAVRDGVRKFPAIWVEGELSEWKPWNDIVFAEIKDDKSRLGIKVDRATVEASGEVFAKGDRVQVFSNIDFWTKSGELRFIVSQIRHKGLGEFIVKIEELRAQLAAEGLFDESRKVPLPYLPLCIGLITGKDTDAEKDVVTNARLRWSDVKFKPLYTAVSGPNAVAQVPAAIAALDADPEVDVIIIARGGGAFLELVAFSDEAIVRAAAACETPIVSAIGHENDRPLLDEVADVRASTPTDAAKRVVPDVAADVALISQLRTRGRTIVTNRFAVEVDRIAALRSRPVMATPFAYVDGQITELANETYRGSMLIDGMLTRANDRLHGAIGRLRTLSPQNTLDRGYSILRGADGRVVTAVAAVTSGDALAIRVADGEIAATAN